MLKRILNKIFFTGSMLAALTVLCSGCIVIVKPAATTDTTTTYSPSLGSISNQSVDQNTTTPVTVSLTSIAPAADAPVSAQTMTVSATSSDTTVLPNGNITVNYVAGSTTGSIDLLPAAGHYGVVTVTVTATEGAPTSRSVSQTFTLTVNSVPGWYVGTETSTGWSFSSTDLPAANFHGRQDGHFEIPNHAYLDAAGVYLYVLGSESARIMKFNYATGTLIGWIGMVRETPTGGDAGCTTTIAGVSTPGWCIGGAANTGTSGVDGGYFSPAGIVDDGTYLYVSDNLRNRVVKINASTGLVVGWIGGVGTTPTGGAGGCTATAQGNPTPGWCTGGNPESGTYYGAFNGPYGIALNGTTLYVADFSNGRLYKIDATTGAFIGWSGRVNSAAGIGGPGTCGALVSGDMTADWCTGGTSSGSSLYGAFNGPRGVSYDGTYIYVADSSTSRIQRRLPADGTAQGWIGRINSVVGIGPAACVTAGSGAAAPVWCTGGTAQAGTADGQFTAAYHAIADATYIYAVDQGRRVQKWNKTTGAFVGWIGAVDSTVGLGGGGTCAATAAGSALPGWCTGGTAQTSMLGGGFYHPVSLHLNTATSQLIVADRNGRISHINAATGAFVNWMGARIDTIRSTWAKESGKVTGHALAQDGGLYAIKGIIENGGNLYVSERWRTQRFAASTGTASGWIGYAQSVFGMAGSATCTALAIGGLSEWCTGGIPFSSTSAFTNGAAITSTGTHLYIIDNTYRIFKYNQSTGALVGWIGRINSVTGLGGAAGCAAAVSGDFTPGWCTGGTGQSGSGDGMLNTAQGITTDGTYLYVTDRGNYRINKYNAATGAFVGWIGRINSIVGLGGDPGCAAATTGTITPGWCTGGSSQTGTVDGAFPALNALMYQGGKLYINDQYKVSKVDATTGAFEGWIGRINSTVGLGGAAGCATAASGDITPGWCTGGSSLSSYLDGGYITSNAVYADGTYLYAVDGSDGKISKYNQSTGVFIGWRGTVSVVPTGGDVNCSTTAIDSVTPGWCTGGESTWDARIIGGFESATAITGDTNYLYVADFRQGRITRISK